MTKTFDAIIIGAGHNGLVCAAYLAKQGQSVLVLEAGAQVGGGAQTREFAPGYRASSCSHFAGQMHPQVLKDLGIKLDYASEDLHTVALSEEGQPLKLSREQVVGPGLSDADVAAFPKFKTRMRTHMNLLAPNLLKTPPRLASGEWSDTKTLMRLGYDLRFRHGKEQMQDLLRIIGINVFDALNECFESDLIKGALSFDAVLGGKMAPRTPNTLFNYLYHLTREIKGATGFSTIRGGMGKLTEAIATAAAGYGADIRVNAPVQKIVSEDGRVTGIELGSGDVLLARRIISNADPKTTLLELLGARHLEAYFAHRLSHFRMKGTAAKLHLALSALPKFIGLDEGELRNRLVIAPSMDEVERAYNPIKYGSFSDQPVMEISLPTLDDKSLAPDGHHVLSATVQYAPYELKSGWEEGKPFFLEAILKRLEAFAPEIRTTVVAAELLTPPDIETAFHMGGGHWHQGEMSFDQIMMMRPVYGTAQYQTPVEGLYLCGAGSHPGGGIMGAAGHNAAAVVLAEEAKS